MSKNLTLFVMAVSVMLHTYAQENWSAVKVFDLNTDDFVYNMYIDSVGTPDGGPVFCFQTSYSKKLIKTNSKGEVIEETDNPYVFYTILNGDTLLSGSVVKNTRGETIAAFSQRYAAYTRIAASSNGIYVYIISEVRGHTTHVVNFLNSEEIIRTSYLEGMCCGDGILYMLLEVYPYGFGRVVYYDEELKTTNEALIPVVGPVGIAEYRGSIYVYSDVDGALYEVEPSLETDDFVCPFRLNYDVVPNRLFIERRSIDNDIWNRIQSILNEEFDGNYQIVRRMGATIEVNADDALIDHAILELLKDDAVICARRAYIDRREHERYLKSGSTGGIESLELYIENNIAYEIKKCYDQSVIDSLANVLGLSRSPDLYEPDIKGMLHAPKTTDIFNLAVKLYESGYFTRIQLQTHKQYFPSTSVQDITQNTAQVVETVYYNLLGQKTTSPAGLTIVVTRYSDGSILTEKKLFR